ncbi:MAG: DUF5343 domain-containing protein [Candidatus Micrarchaeia archaeon]
MGENIEELTEVNIVSENKKPPYACSYSWFKKFVEISRKSKINKVDSTWVKDNIVGSKNEYKVVSTLKFLNIIDEKGMVTEKINLLSKEPLKIGLYEITKDAYSDLFNTVPLERASYENLINYFVDRFKYTQKQARMAANFFISLAKDSDIKLSEKLIEQKVPKSTEIVKTTSKILPKKELMGAMPTANIQININIILDKDTPLEIWQTILKLLKIQNASS